MKTIIKILIVVVLLIIVGLLVFGIYMRETYLSEEEVKTIVINDMGQAESDIYFKKIEFEFDEKIYEVNVYYNNVEYEYKIEAKDGQIVYTDYLNSTNTTEEDNTITDELSLDDAKAIAFQQANVNESDITLTKAIEKVEHGVTVYEIEFTDASYEYEITINKSTGEIIAYDKDNLHSR